AAYHFLVERGLDREPQDGLELLRRARPRAYHIRWRGPPRRAQDLFDASELLRRFIVDLTGDPPPRPGLWPMDGRQPERAYLYDHGPAAPFEPAKKKELLLDAELYPHGVHIVGEGPTEQIIVERVVEALVGRHHLREIEFFDLEGVGSAAQVPPLV